MLLLALNLTTTVNYKFLFYFAKKEVLTFSPLSSKEISYSPLRGVAQDDKEAVDWYCEAAEQGDVNAQNNLGLMYEKGKGVAQDYKEAVAWYRKAAE